MMHDAEGDEGSNGGRGDVGRKEVRVLLEGGDGSGGSKAHYSCRRRCRGLVYRGRRGRGRRGTGYSSRCLKSMEYLRRRGL